MHRCAFYEEIMNMAPVAGLMSHSMKREGTKTPVHGFVSVNIYVGYLFVCCVRDVVLCYSPWQLYGWMVTVVALYDPGGEADS